ncbi:outer membrane protein assembly factor BamE [Sphingomonas bacterium]|uniref:outer membrane protein assembly factor BamE n=1 Tax=Sphingomonas bacterium TaxID=1895847 RepID=UPI00157551CA|nr:outer membrane protein assembly factor BamE [Sphingomonas bacterium]
MRVRPSLSPLCRILALAAAAALASGCTKLRSHQGYIIDADLVNSVQPGVDTRDSVAKVLGQPSFRSQFGEQNWYYLSRDSRNYAYTRPRATDQLTLEISFDRTGTVSAVRRSGVEQIAAVDALAKTTPTLGRTRGFFQDLFGNIGTVGAAGTGTPDNTNTGRQRTQP